MSPVHRFRAAGLRVVLALGCTFFAWAGLAQEERTRVEYQTHDRVIQNPERGWLKAEDTWASQYFPLSGQNLPVVLATDAYDDKGVTLVRRLFYLNEYFDSDIPQAFLNNVDADFNTLRGLGLKAVVRFAYSDDGAANPRDASEARILGHIAQLAPILQDNADVIALMETGFIGIWGEWYYSDSFSQPDNTVTPAQYRDRGDVLAALQAALPNRFILIRTPLFKQTIEAIDFGEDLAPNMEMVGHVNDCFLKNDTDAGTYVAVLPVENPETNAEYQYLMEETLTVPMGGETCGIPRQPTDGSPPIVINPERRTCATALLQLEQLHWSYLNADYHADVLNLWDDCRGQITNRLGYRLSLNFSDIESLERLGGALSYTIELSNTGWAAPYNPRSVELVLRNVHAGGDPVRLPLVGVDPTEWTSATAENPVHRITGTVTVDGLEAGVYDVLL
ncbi:MAG: DUF4832 domain-containing protein, partial [Acidobacteriota bacterium]